MQTAGKSESEFLSTDLNLEDCSGTPIISITFPKDGQQRARKVVSRSRARPTGKYPSWKMGRMIQWESVNELNVYRLLDANPQVNAFYEQPVTIRYNQGGSPHTHYPDTLVQWEQNNEFWEIKSAKEAVKSKYTGRTQILEEALPQLGFNYRLIVAENFVKEPRLSNSLILLKFGRNAGSPLTEEKLRLILADTGSISWGSIIKGSMGTKGRNLICRLVLEGVVTFNIDQPLQPETNFYWCEGNNNSAGWNI